MDGIRYHKCGGHMTATAAAVRLATNGIKWTVIKALKFIRAVAEMKPTYVFVVDDSVPGKTSFIKITVYMCSRKMNNNCLREWISC